jgi:hypothetical protein
VKAAIMLFADTDRAKELFRSASASACSRGLGGRAATGVELNPSPSAHGHIGTQPKPDE